MMNETQTPGRTETRFHVNPEQIEDRLYQQCLKSRHHSSGVEDRDVWQKVSMRTDIGHLRSRSFPKLKQNNL